MFRKNFIKGILLATVFDFAIFASDEIGYLSSENDSGLSDSFEEVEIQVKNPIPTILSETVPNWEDSLKLKFIGSAFSTAFNSLESDYKSSISEFEKYNSEEKIQWDKNLSLLKESVQYLSLTSMNYIEKRDSILNLSEKLILITNNGFHDKIALACEDKPYKEVILPILDRTCDLLWDARELLGFIIAANEQDIIASDLPQLCDQIKIGTSAIIKLQSSAKIPAEDIQMKFWRLVDGFGYYDQAEIQNDLKHRQKIEQILGNSSVTSIVMEAFSS